MNNWLLPKANVKNLSAMTASLKEQLKSNEIFSASVIAKVSHDMVIELLSDDTLSSDKKLAFAKGLYDDVKSEIETIVHMSLNERSTFISRKNAYKAYSKDT